MVLIPYKEANRIHFFQFKNQAKKREQIIQERKSHKIVH